MNPDLRVEAKEQHQEWLRDEAKEHGARESGPGSPSRSGPFNGTGDFENEAKERPPVTRQERHAEETVGH